MKKKKKREHLITWIIRANMPEESHFLKTSQHSTEEVGSWNVGKIFDSSVA